MAKKWQKLIELRTAAGLSQYDLAKRLGINRSTLGNYENGIREPDFATTQQLADFFQVSVDVLLGRGEPDHRDPTADIPDEWRRLVLSARREGYSPDEVIQALRLLSSVRRQQESLKRSERED